jgi:RimJ/RimL family protein N-acetyltransferase
MKDEIKLIRAEVDDISEIYRLASKIWNAHYVPIIGQVQVNYMLEKMYSSESLSDQLVTKNHLFYLIQAMGQNIGFISLSGQENMFIHKFYIDQDVQSKGYGAQVFHQILENFPTARSFELTVNRKNYKSINFYFKIGFKIDHIDDFDIGDGYWMNDFIMRYYQVNN